MNKKLITKLAAIVVLSTMSLGTMGYSIPVEDTLSGKISSETFEILQDEKDGVVKGDYYLGTTKEHYTWGIQPDKDAEPGLRITSGSTVTIDTLSHEGMLEDQGKNPVAYFAKYDVSSEGVLEDAKEICETNTTHNFDGEGPHILTSPIYIEDAQPGDVLKVEVLDLVPRVPYGVISNRHYKGALVGEFPENEGRLEGADAAHYEDYNNVSVYAPIKKIDGQYYCYLNQGSKDLAFPIKPFLGTMGVVSATESHLSSVPPSALGGNIDINELGVGSTLYLPVEVAGGLFYTGDPHFVQGDGEVALTALEGSLRATLRFTVLKKGSGEIPGDGNDFDQVFGETEDYWIPVGLNEDLDEAMKQSVRESIDFINEQFGIERKMAYAYLSAATDYEVSQVVDKVKGIHAIIAKANFNDYISLKLQVGSQTLSGKFINDKPYVSANQVAAALGASIKYDDPKIEIIYNHQSYEMAVDANVYTTPDKTVTLTTSPVLYKDQVMLPTCVLKEVLGMGLNWSTEGKDIVGVVSVYN